MSSCADRWLSYDTVKIVRVENWVLGALHYSLMLIILAYVLGYSIFWERGYQTTSPVIGTVSVKIKGSGVQQQVNNTVWDAIDIVYPSLEDSAAFITTNAILTPGQTRGFWDSGLSCGNCTAGALTEYGVLTGKCLNNDTTCEVDGWGPLEVEPANLNMTTISGLNNMTLFIRSNAFFSSFGVRRDNIGNELGPLNFMTLQSLLDQAKLDYWDVAEKGCIIVALVQWECDFDPWSGDCNPKFQFYRIDDPDQSFSSGFNYRYATSYREDGVLMRDLYKVFGIRLLFITGGVGWRTSIVPLMINIGSGLALFTVSTFIVDFLIVYLLPSSPKYKSKKIAVVPRDALRKDSSSSSKFSTTGSFSDYRDPDEKSYLRA